MNAHTTVGAQLAEIRVLIAKWRDDAAECDRIAAKAMQTAAQSTAEAEASREMVRRWEVVHDAVRFGVVPNLDGCKGPETDEVPF